MKMKSQGVNNHSQVAHKIHQVFARYCLSFIILSSVLVSVAGCGFQLRGEQTLPFSTIAIVGNANYVTTGQMTQAISSVSGTQIVPNLGNAEAGLYILSEDRDKVITALSAAGRVREYELRLRVTFRLIDKKGDELIRPSEIMLFRLLPYDESQVLSKGEEEALLYRDMQNDIISQIMRRLAAVKPS